jgi:EmrB/QacA subfamily drug resistance transporter
MTNETTIEVGDAPPALSHKQVLVVFSGLMLGMFLAALDGTIVATALPTITGELGGLDHLSWVVTSYLLASTVSTPIYGKLGDLFGRKRLFQGAIVVFLAGSIFSGLAQDMPQLIASRAIQGLGGGGLIVLAQSIMAEIVSPRERGRYSGYFGAVFGASSVAGPLLGGMFTDQLSWRWVFYINIPLGIVAFLLATIVLPRGTRRQGVRVDILGGTVLTAAVSCVVLLTTWGGTEYAWGSSMIIGLIVLAVALIALLLVVERRAPEPILPMHLFSNRTFTVSSGASFIVGMGMFGAISFIPLFLQVVNGASATSSGLLLVPLMVGLLGASIMSGQVISRTGHYKSFPIVGCSLATVALFLLSTMGTDTSRLTASAYMVVLGTGIGLTMQVLVLATQNAISLADIGAGTSSVSFFRSMGGSLGVALFGALFNSGLRSKLSGLTVSVGEGSEFRPEVLDDLGPADRAAAVDAFADSLTTVFLIASPLMLVALLIVFALPVKPLRPSLHTEDHGRETSVAGAGGTAESDAFEYDRLTASHHV